MPAPTVKAILTLAAIAADMPDVSADFGQVMHVAGEAIRHATPRVPAELLVALAWGESRFESDAKPGCGVLQVFPRDIGLGDFAYCDRWRASVGEAVAAGVQEIEMMLDDHRVRGSMTGALLYRACGNVAFDGTCSQAKVRWVAKALERWRDVSRRVAAAE